jgi:hypothetical protein
MAPSGQIAMQCPQPMQPNNEVSVSATFLSMICRLKSLHTETQDPQPVHNSLLIRISAFSFVLEVGMAMIYFSFIIEKHSKFVPGISSFHLGLLLNDGAFIQSV